VILVSLDTLRADRLGAYDYRERPVSPNMDALAEDGILHLQHIAASPWTTPSHASLLS
jgi:arylsulfatase A-like enzyme